MALKVLFIISVIVSLCLSAALLALGAYEILWDQEAKQKTDDKFVATHVFIALAIFWMCNLIIVFHVIYVTQYVLRGLRYSWHISCHYFFYLVLEIISIVCIIGTYNYLHFPLLLHILTGILAGTLFWFNFWAVKLFDKLDDEIEAKKEERKLRAESISPTKKVPCVRVPLADAGASTSTAPPKKGK